METGLGSARRKNNHSVLRSLITCSEEAYELNCVPNKTYVEVPNPNISKMLAYFSNEDLYRAMKLKNEVTGALIHVRAGYPY